MYEDQTELAGRAETLTIRIDILTSKAIVTLRDL
uniref:Uncharacterized protein n=1 Tax=Peronospora matthiolae TaxID=2874970 RepID=A0AAV1VEG0_9STRA